MALWLLVCTTGAQSQTTLTVNPQQVSLSAPAGSTTAVAQTVTLLSPGRSVPFTTSVRYFSAATGWLAVSPASGTAPTTLTISANPTNLAAGIYSGQVLIEAGSLTTYVNVVLNIVTPPGNRLAVDQTGLTFIAESGAAVLPVQTLSVIAARGVAAPVAFTAAATSAGNWLSVSPPSAATPATLSVFAIRTPMMSGVLTGTITLTPVGGGAPTIVPVALLATGSTETPVTLSLSQTALTVNHQHGVGAPPAQIVYVNSTGRSVTYTATTTTPWLSLQTVFSSGMTVTDETPSQLAVVVDPGSLAPGTYIGTVTITSPGLPPVELPVSLTVTTTPALNADPSSLVFDDLNVQLPVTVTSTGSSNLSFTASSSAPWLSVVPLTGSTAEGFELLTVTVNPSGLAPGTYNATVTLTVQGTGATLRIPVRLTVSGTGAATALEISAESVELTGVVNAASPAKPLIVRAPVSAPHTFTAAGVSPEGWLLVEPFLATTPASITIRANSAAVAPGIYEGVVLITSLLTGEQTKVPVKFTLVEQSLVTDPASLDFVQEKRGVPPAPKSLQVTGVPPIGFTVSNALSWLTVTPDRGLTPTTLLVAVEPTGLPPGVTRGSIQLNGPNGRLTIPVSLSVAEPPAPTVAPEAITFSYELGSPAPAAQSINIGSTGDMVRFTATARTESGTNWLSVAPSSGSTPATLTAAVSTAQLVPGRHAGTITVASADGSVAPRSVPVTLTVTSSSVAVQGLLHGATLSATPIAPGQIVTLTGTGLGPAAGVTARPTAAGAFESRLSDIRVLFDGVPAPLLYVRNDQINAIVPYALHGRSSARVQVEAGTSFSIPIEAKVVDAVPGLFTSGAAGRGQAAALNSDFTVNSAVNPAARGSIIILFGTGEGQTDPPGQDGRVILTDLRRPRLPVAARIGGRSAEVLYFGSAPSLVSGVFQANIRIPEEAPVGLALIDVQVGGETTQSGVTIAVR
jgi:uncharacterized protein (TIGR03437 family)